MDEDEKAKAGYQAAIQMITYEGKIIWKSFQGLLSANTLLIVLTGIIVKFYPNYPALKTIFGIAGLLLCLFWILVVMRQFDYYKYWHVWARILEKHLCPPVKILVEGEKFSKGETAFISQPNGNNNLRMRWGSRLFRVEWLIYLVILIFIVLYIISLFFI